jgi:hypothetical protein
VKNAKAVYSAASIVHLGRKHNIIPFPTGPTIGKLVSQTQLVKHDAAHAVVRGLNAEISAVGGHSCPVCATVLEYNTFVENLGGFVQHLAAMRQHGRDDVLDRIALEAGYSRDLVYEMTKKRTVPASVSNDVLTACHAQFGQHASSWGLGLRTLPPHACQPIAMNPGRTLITSKYSAQCSNNGC